jgi:hypothetical protein
LSFYFITKLNNLSSKSFKIFSNEIFVIYPELIISYPNLINLRRRNLSFTNEYILQDKLNLELDLLIQLKLLYHQFFLIIHYLVKM